MRWFDISPKCILTHWIKYCRFLNLTIPEAKIFGISLEYFIIWKSFTWLNFILETLYLKIWLIKLINFENWFFGRKQRQKFWFKNERNWLTPDSWKQINNCVEREFQSFWRTEKTIWNSFKNEEQLNNLVEQYGQTGLDGSWNNHFQKIKHSQTKFIKNRRGKAMFIQYLSFWIL